MNTPHLQKQILKLFQQLEKDELLNEDHLNKLEQLKTLVSVSLERNMHYDKGMSEKTKLYESDSDEDEIVRKSGKKN